MADAATRITYQHKALLDAETRDLMDWQAAHPDRMAVRFVADVEASKALNDVRLWGGDRFGKRHVRRRASKYHLRENLSRPGAASSSPAFRRPAPGPAAGGRRPAGPPVRRAGAGAGAIYTVGAFAHADRDALLAWLANFAKPPGPTWCWRRRRQRPSSKPSPAATAGRKLEQRAKKFVPL